MLLSQLRHYGYVLDDPLVEGWLEPRAHAWRRPATSHGSHSPSSC
jgi:hypothetical protein